MREQAVRLRLQGRSYKEIQGELGVSRSTLSLWLRDLPLVAEHRARLLSRQLAPNQRRAAALRASAAARHERIARAATAEIGSLTARELFIAGVVAYWAEGSKTKPWSERRLVQFINSDAGMIRLFLRWLEHLEIPRPSLTFRLSIHASADVEAATTFWSRVVGAPEDAFQRPTLKRHNPTTLRKNTRSDYHGCLVVTVRRSTELNTRIAGWFDGVVQALLAEEGSTGKAGQADTGPGPDGTRSGVV